MKNLSQINSDYEESRQNLSSLSDGTEISQVVKYTSGVSTLDQIDSKAQQPVSNENKEIDAISASNREIDSDNNILINKNWSVVEKLFDNKKYKQVENIKTEFFNKSAEYRMKLYKTTLDTKLIALHEKCDASLKMLKSEYRQRVSSFLMKKMEELSKEISERQKSFIELIKEKYAFAKTIEDHKSLYGKYLSSIYEEEARYLNWLVSNIQRFESIISEEQNRY